ncbi:Putative regulatory protein, LuxR [Mycobacteroides abscessus subsp. massiliense]|nr:Putative regulatory protein, LuxR [Mycobacteroides abscessus subsp. massiliense]
MEAEALHRSARFGDRTVARRLESLAPRVHGPLVVLYARHALAVSASDSAALVQISIEFENASLLLSAGQCGGAATPAIRAAARPLPVTAREREIAALIDEGLCNREIAERLTLSVRTIGGAHLPRLHQTRCRGSRSACQDRVE